MEGLSRKTTWQINWCPKLTFTNRQESEVKLLSRVQLFVTRWTVAYQAPQSMEIFQARILEWVAISFSRDSSRPRDWTWVSHVAGRCFTIWDTREAIAGRFFTNWAIREAHQAGKMHLTSPNGLLGGYFLWCLFFNCENFNIELIKMKNTCGVRKVCFWDGSGFSHVATASGYLLLSYKR